MILNDLGKDNSYSGQQVLSSGLTLTWACSSQTGQREVNEDRFSIARSADASQYFFGIFDGHSGAETARFVSKSLPLSIFSQMKQTIKSISHSEARRPSISLSVSHCGSSSSSTHSSTRSSATDLRSSPTDLSKRHKGFIRRRLTPIHKSSKRLFKSFFRKDSKSSKQVEEPVANLSEGAANATEVSILQAAHAVDKLYHPLDNEKSGCTACFLVININSPVLTTFPSRRHTESGSTQSSRLSEASVPSSPKSPSQTSVLMQKSPESVATSTSSVSSLSTMFSMYGLEPSPSEHEERKMDATLTTPEKKSGRHMLSPAPATPDSCASVLPVAPTVGSQLWATAAVVGDCEVVMCEKDKTEARSLLPQHTPKNVEEKRRLEANPQASIHPVSKRLCIPGTKAGVLNVSRSFGDFTFKRGAEVCGKPKHGKVLKEDIVTCHPALCSVELSGSQTSVEFVILGSDGLWDVIRPSQAVKFVREGLSQMGAWSFEGGTANNGLADLPAVLERVCNALVTRATSCARGGDNITAIVVFITGHACYHEPASPLKLQPHLEEM